MRKAWLGMGLLLACAQAAAGDRHVNFNCNVDSDYRFALNERSAIFTRSDGAPRAIVMRKGRLFVDDKWVALSAADRDRVADYERQSREIMPLALQVGRAAADIAFTALGEVAAGFSSHPADTRSKLAAARAKLDAELVRSVTPAHFDSQALGGGIGKAVREVLPMVMGDIVGGAVRAALSGDTARLQRMGDMDKEIDARIQPRADALERNAEGLCRRMEALDRIDNALEYRTSSGAPLNLLRIKPPAPPKQRDDA
ncbi:MAG: DUF2884 family protein [Luteimonas sp.]